MRSRSDRGGSPSWVARGLATIGAVALVGAAAYENGVALASPPFTALQAVFRHIMYPLLSGERSVQIFRSAFAVYFILVVTAVATALIAFNRHLRRVVPPGSYLGRVAGGFGLMAFGTYLLNWQIQGGLGIPFALAYAALLLVAWWAIQRHDPLVSITQAVVWVGFGFLASSGCIIPLSTGAPRYQ